MEHDKSQGPTTAVPGDSIITTTKAMEACEIIPPDVLPTVVEPAAGVAVVGLAAVAETLAADGASTMHMGRVAPFDSTCADLTPVVPMDDVEENGQALAFGVRLRRVEEAIEAAEAIFCLATADVEPSSVPAPLVATVTAGRGVFLLRDTLVEATLKEGDTGVSRCLAVASRAEALGRCYSRLSEGVRARTALTHVTEWLLDIDNRHPYTERPADASAVVDIADTDMWMPVVDIAYAAGRLCSMPLLERAHTEIGRRAKEHTHTLAEYASNTWGPRWASQFPVKDCMEIATTAVEAFAKGLTRPAEGLPPHHDCMAVCRGPARAIVCTARETRLDHDAQMAEWSIYPRESIDQTHVMRLYMLGLLTRFVTIGSSLFGLEDDDVPLQKFALYLGDPTDPSRDIALESLDIIGDEVDLAHEPEASHGPVAARPLHPQDDLLAGLWKHHPDLFLAVLAHVRPWDIGSLAQCSRTHYAHVVKAVRDDDAAGTARRLGLMAFSGTLQLQRHIDSPTYDPVAQVVTPPPPQSTQEGLSDLRPLLFLCRSMALREHDERLKQWSTGRLARSRELVASKELAAACALGCGGAIARCIDWMDIRQRPDSHYSHELYDSRVGRLAEEAGFYGSPMMLHIAITESLAAIPWTENWSDGGRTRLDRQVRHLVCRTASGIAKGLKYFDSSYTRGHRRHRRRLDGLPALVDVLCTFLAGARHEMTSGHLCMWTRVSLCKAFHVAAITVLDPGTCLDMSRLRTRLALVLLEIARSVWMGECARD
ncbi:hypothetical protein pclt_cds_636 [Pandoravirus celtis]|uniref:DUF5867 domain-containing protein n=1 Tax=Pandoravirus celtis TaxID=2568002 RepID=A0A4D6EIA2_9VIRU|nr:hypothetical protein pclt_cds_636 [Pandoravirus celtis]